MVTISISTEFEEYFMKLDRSRILKLIEVARYSKSDFDVLYPSTSLTDDDLKMIRRLKSSSRKIKRSRIEAALTDEEISKMYGKSAECKRLRRKVCYEKDLSIVELDEMTRQIKSKKRSRDIDRTFVRWLIEECYYTRERLMKEYSCRLSEVFDQSELDKFKYLDRSEAEKRCLDRVRKYLKKNFSKFVAGEISNQDISKDCHALDESPVKYLREILGDEYEKIKLKHKSERYSATCEERYGSTNFFSSRDCVNDLTTSRVFETSKCLKFEPISMKTLQEKRFYKRLKDIDPTTICRLIESEGYSVSDIKHRIEEDVTVNDIKSSIRSFSQEKNQSIVLKLRKTDQDRFASLHADKIFATSTADIESLSLRDLHDLYHVPKSLVDRVKQILNGDEFLTMSDMVNETIKRLKSDDLINDSIFRKILVSGETIQTFVIGLFSRRATAIDLMIDIVNDLYPSEILYSNCKLFELLKIDFNREELIEISNKSKITLSNEDLDRVTMSSYERKIYEILIRYVDRSDISIRDRTVLNGLELDFLIRSKNLAIEVNPTYRHHSNQLIDDRNRIIKIDGKDIDYHKRKYQDCKDYGIRLISFYEYDFQDDRFESFTVRLLEEILSSERHEIVDVEIKESVDRDRRFASRFVSQELQCTHVAEMISISNQTVSKIYLHQEKSTMSIVDLDIDSSLEIFNKDRNLMTRLIEKIFNEFSDVQEVKIFSQNDYAIIPIDYRKRVIENEIWSVDEFSSYQTFNKDNLDSLTRFNVVSTCGLSHEIVERDNFSKIIKRNEVI